MSTEIIEAPGGTARRGLQLALILIIIALLAGLVASVYSYYQARNEITALQDSLNSVARQESDRLIADVGKHIALPDELPTIATVEDREKLNDQRFFANAQNGDKVLMYAIARKAILYRPNEDKLIEVATLDIQSQ